MTPAEQQLQDGLRDLAGAPEAIDLDAVLRQGQRIRRNRWTRWTVAATASVAVIALVVWPRNGTSPIPAVPAPAQTPTIAEPTPVRATAELPFEIHDPNDLAFTRVNVEATRDGDRTSLDVVAQPVTGGQVEQHYEVTGTGFWYATVSPGLELALIPGQVERLITLGGFGQAVDRQALQLMDATVVAIQPGADDHEFPGLLWLDTDGTLHNSFGDVVPSADLPYTLVEPGGPPAARQVTVFRDAGLGAWGYLDSNSDDGVAHPLASEPTDTMVGISATADDDYFYNDIRVGFLPEGGSDPDLTLSIANADWTSAEVGDTGRIALLAVAEKIQRGQPLVKEITFIDRDGVRTSYAPLAPRADTEAPSSTQFDPVCHDLTDYRDVSADGRNANTIANLFQTYHGAGRPNELPSQAQAVDAGDGYWVVAAVVHGETTLWLAWGNDDDELGLAAPYGNFLHWAEVAAPEDWDGGSAPYGTEALSSAVACLR